MVAPSGGMARGAALEFHPKGLPLLTKACSGDSQEFGKPTEFFVQGRE